MSDDTAGSGAGSKPHENAEERDMAKPLLQDLRDEKVPRQLVGELALFERRHAEFWKQHPRKYVLIHRGEVLGFFPSSEEAHGAGYEKVGFDEPFLVRQILEDPKGEIDTYNLMRVTELAIDA